MRISEIILDAQLFLLYVRHVFPTPPAAGLAYQPRKGLGARVAGGLSRLGAALRSVVAGRPRRPQSGPDSRPAPDADTPPAARPARTPRQPGRARKGGLARLFRRRSMAAVPEQYREPPDLQFTAEAFPALSPEARAFFNTPLEDCDPAMLGVVLGALAELITGSMTPREGMRDAQDVFLALSSRMAAVTGEAGQAPPAALPEAAAAPADLAAPAAIDPQAAAPDLPGPAPSSPAQRRSFPARRCSSPTRRCFPAQRCSSPAQRRSFPAQRCSSPAQRCGRTRPRRHPRGLNSHTAKRPRPAPRPISPPRRQPGRLHHAFRSAAPARATRTRRTAAASRHVTRDARYSVPGRGSRREAVYCHRRTLWSAAVM